MMRKAWSKLGTVAVSLATVLSLAGCTIPLINVELPFDAPDLSGIKLPDLSGINLPDIDLSTLPVPEFTLPIGVTTSVEEARESVLGGKVATLSSDALVKPGYLTVGVKPLTSSAPLCVEGEGGSVYGLDVDIAAALASELGLKVRYLSVVDETTLGTECDVVMDIASDDPTKIAIAGSYVESASSFFHRGTTTVVVPTDLGGKSVGVQGGSVSETALNRTGLKMSQKAYANLNEAFDALDVGEVDFVLCEAYPGAYLASLREGIAFAGALEAPETAGIAVLASNAPLTEALTNAFATISGNGVLDIVRARWVGQMPALTTDSQIQGVPEGAKKPKADVQPVESEDATSEDAASEEGDGSDAGSNAITEVNG